MTVPLWAMVVLCVAAIPVLLFAGLGLAVWAQYRGWWPYR